jgi:hypothetical protein
MDPKRLLKELQGRDDVEVQPDWYTWARRDLGEQYGASRHLDWYPLVGLGRSRISRSDGTFEYGHSV